MTDVSANSPVQLSESAVAHFVKRLKKDSNLCGVRVAVLTGKGCSGMEYAIDFADSSAIKDSDLSFQWSEGLLLYVDKASVPFLRGMQIDLRAGGLDGRFSELVLENPNAEDVCGCGKSFRAVVPPDGAVTSEEE